MRHGNVHRKFGREKNQRVALLRSLTRSLILRGRMETTLAKAKEVRPLVEKLLTRAKRGGLDDRRTLTAALGSPAMTRKLIVTAAAYRDRAGGYTRITKIGPRRGDAAPMAIIEFV